MTPAYLRDSAQCFDAYGSFFDVTYLLFRCLVYFSQTGVLDFRIYNCLFFCIVLNNLVINRQFGDIVVAYYIKCIVIVLSNFCWLISEYTAWIRQTCRYLGISRISSYFLIVNSTLSSANCHYIAGIY